MIQQGFYIQKTIPRPWWFMVYYNVKDNNDLTKIFGVLLSSGISEEKAATAINVLKNKDTAYIYSNVKERYTVIILAEVTSKMEFLNSITHELQHATQHICEYFNIDYSSEHAAYIQGEIGEQLYNGVALILCPCCQKKPQKNFLVKN